MIQPKLDVSTLEWVRARITDAHWMVDDYPALAETTFEDREMFTDFIVKLINKMIDTEETSENEHKK